MQGHEPLVRIRKQGYKPAGLVFVADYPVKKQSLDWFSGESCPTICTHGADIDGIDFRFLVGLSVCISGENMHRVKKLAAAARRAEAAQVIASAKDKYAAWKKGDAEWLVF